MALATGNLQRTPVTPDLNLLLRATGLAAIATTGGDPKAPDFLSDAISVGAGQVEGRAVIDVSALTLNAANDTFFKFVVIGINAGATVQAVLGELTLGCAELIADTVDTVAGRYNILFRNEKLGVLFPTIKLGLIQDGTTASITFSAVLNLNHKA